MRALGLALGAALFAALLVYLGLAIARGDVALGQARPGPIVAALALLLGAYAAQALAWHLLVRAAGVDRSLAVDASRWALSLLGKYVPGKVFNAVGRLVLYRDVPQGVPAIAAAFVAEALLTIAAASGVAAIALATVRDTVPALALVAAGACAAGGVLVSFSTLFDRAAGWLAARVLRTRAPPPIPVGSRVAPLALHVVSYTLLGGGLHALAAAWPMTQSLPVAAAIGALGLSGVAGIAAFVVPAGLGVREGVLAWIVAPFAGPAAAALVAVAARVWLTAGDVLAVALGAWLARGARSQ